MIAAENPFAGDADRAEIWEMLVRRDIAAFVGQDWAMVAGDFDESRFLGIHAHNSANPDDWNAAFPTLAGYRDEWLRQAAETAATEFAEPLADGSDDVLNWQTLYFCRKAGERWKITSFVGYMKYR